MDIDILKKELRELDYGLENTFCYPDKMLPEAIDDLLNDLVDGGSWDDSIIDNMVDKILWEVDILVEGENFILVGDIYCGSFEIIKEKIKK